MKNKFLLLLTILLPFLIGVSSCHKVEDLTPSTSRAGINNITASFDNDNSSENEFSSEIDYANGVIKIIFPYNYPRTSNNVLTMDKLTHVRVKANLDDNVTISPGILYMDFTKDNYIEVTDQSKKVKQYKVIAEIRKSSEAVITNYNLTTLGISGVVDEANKVISLISIDPIGSTLADVSISHGATISPDPTKTALDYNSDIKVTVTAQNGVTKSVYTIKKAVPKKTAFGMRAGSAKVLWAKKLGVDLGLTAMNATTGIAATKDYLVINTRNQASIYLNRKTGEIAGTLNMSSIVGNLINFYNTCDDNDNILVCNLASGTVAFKVWKIKGVAGTPELYIDWNGGLAVGRKLSVKGNIDGDAVITAAILGAGNQFARWQVKGGVLKSQTPEIVTITGIGAAWWNNCDVVATNPSNVNGDYLAAYYASPYKLAGVDGPTNTVKAWGPALSSNWISNAVDFTIFNNCPYTVQNSVNSFTWGSDDVVYLYDISSAVGFSTPLWSCPIGTYGGKDNGGQNGNGTGDVALKVSDNGYYMYLYFMFTNGQVVCVQYDCIDM